MGVFINTVRWPAELYDAIRAEAVRQGISINALIVEAGKRYMTEIAERDTGRCR
jgi:predicted HicB family RNase H-like nuclease